MEVVSKIVFTLILGVCYVVGAVIIYSLTVYLMLKYRRSYVECKHAANMWAFIKATGG